MQSPVSQSIPSAEEADLPRCLFELNCYPSHPVRINSYSRPRYLLDVLNVLDGMPELQELLASPLGSLFSIPVRQSSLSGQLVHQLLCRQLCSTNTNEIWFIFAGQSLRFSLIEFAEVTGLCCSAFPPAAELLSATTHADGSAPYWYTLIGRQVGTATVDDLVVSLKSDTTMPAWRKFRLALVVIVEGILLCRTQPVKPSMEVVEMVKNVDFFLQYPWGRQSFNRIIRMVKVGDYIADNTSLIRKLQQSSMAVHGFPLAIQLFAFRTIPALLKFLPHLDHHSTFLHQSVAYLPKCRAFHASNILAVENDTTVEVLFPHPSFSPFISSNQPDCKILNLERLLCCGHKFNKGSWDHVSTPICHIYSSLKRQRPLSKTTPLPASEQTWASVRHRIKKRKIVNIVRFVDDIVEYKLQGFKESLVADLSHLLLNALPTSPHTHSDGSSQPVQKLLTSSQQISSASLPSTHTPLGSPLSIIWLPGWELCGPTPTTPTLCTDDPQGLHANTLDVGSGSIRCPEC